MNYILPWYMFAIIAPIIWGLHYTLITKIAREMPADMWTPFVIFLLPCLPITIIAIIFHNKIFKTLQLLYYQPFDIQVAALTVSITSIIGAISIYSALATAKNATAVSIIEMSFPVFVSIFAIFILKENHFTTQTIIGFLLVLIGVLVVLKG